MPLAGQVGLAAIGIPSTIDNNVWGSDWTLGFDSACNLTLGLLDGLNATGSSLGERIFVLETLGGDTGHLALRVAEAGQADYALVPEVEPDLPHATEALKRALAQRGWAVLVLGEGVPEARSVAEKLSEQAGSRLRYSATGHAARGAPVSGLDRWLARSWAERALDLLLEGQTGLVLGYTDRLVELPLAEVAAQRKQLDVALYERINTRWGGSL
jgi:6-phosphofructokinase 1